MLINNYSIHKILIIILLPLLTACGQTGAEPLKQGNVAYGEGKFEQALEAYREAQMEAPTLAEPFYNTANTHYRKNEADLVELRVKQAIKNAEEAGNQALAEDALFTLANSYYQAQMLPEAASTYEEILWRNPHAHDARHNLELVLQQLAEQPEQEQNQDQEQQDQENQEEDQEQEQNQDEQNQDESEQNEQQQDQSGEDESEQEQEEQSSGSDENQAEEEQEEEQPPPADGEEESEENQDPQQAGTQPMPVQPLTPEQAAQLLESAARDSESLQQYLQQQMQFPNQPIDEDW